GMATTGLVPFVHSLAVFSTRRICDQVFLSCSYAGLNVKIIGGDSGVAAAFNGGTHMAFEDIAIMRSIPEITILEPTDTVMMKAIVPKIAETYGVFYVRYVRRKVKHVYDDGETFEIGKAKVLRDGKDITLIASGLTVAEAKEAAEILKDEGIEARVVDMFTIKPIDVACILESAQKTGAILTVENHNVIGGLGSAVAEVLSENCPTPLLRMGIQEEFGEVGTQDYLMERYHLTAAHIVRNAKEFLKKTKGVK
ncbi:MAG: transketolase family protein, partial [Clostridia bacterium]|nr:transketolase family protein [Clostridia bacterium]